MDIRAGKKNRAFGCIILLAAFFYCAGLNNHLPLQEDSCIYLSLAQAMGRGLGYTYTVEPIDRPANYYPPAYPAMLIPVIYLFGPNYIAAKILGILLTLIIIGIFFCSFGAVFKDNNALILVSLLAFNGEIAFYSRQILTEIPYLLFSFIAVYFVERYIQGPGIFNRYCFAAALSMAMAFYTRSIGVVLAAAAFIYFIYQRKASKAIALVSLFIVSVIGWVCRGIFIGRNAYVLEFQSQTKGLWELLRRMIYNLAATVGKELPDLFFYPFLNTIDPRSLIFTLKFLFGTAIASVLLYGLFKKIKDKGLGFFDVYSVAYFCFYLSWTHHGARYLVVLLPFLSYYLFIGIKGLAGGGFVFKTAVSAIIFLNVLGCIKEIARERNSPYSLPESTFVSAVDWLKENALSSSIILSRRNNWIYVYSGGLKGLKLLRTRNTRAQYAYVMDNKVDYIVIDQNKIYRDDARDYLAPLVEDYPGSFEMAYASSNEPRTHIYKVKR